MCKTLENLNSEKKKIELKLNKKMGKIKIVFKLSCFNGFSEILCLKSVFISDLSFIHPDLKWSPHYGASWIKHDLTFKFGTHLTKFLPPQYVILYTQVENDFIPKPKISIFKCLCDLTKNYPSLTEKGQKNFYFIYILLFWIKTGYKIDI